MLQQVIKALSSGIDFPNITKIPYSEYKLTSFLKECISGRSYLLFLGCLSPGDPNYEEQLSTLNYALGIKINNSRGDSAKTISTISRIGSAKSGPALTDINYSRIGELKERNKIL